MDHTPGMRQFRNMEKLKEYYRGSSSMTEAQMEEFIATRLELRGQFAEKHRTALVALAHRHGVALASHHDTTAEQVDEALRQGVSIAEFPVTVEAAQASRAVGIRVMMGAPNLARGGSHSGNVAAVDLARAGLLDILSSDYVPASLLFAAFQLPKLVPGISLPEALGTVTHAPAAAAGLADRGAIGAGKLADLIRVDDRSEVPVVRMVWTGGRRVS